MIHTTLKLIISHSTPKTIKNNEGNDEHTLLFQHNSAVITSSELQQIIKSQKAKDFWNDIYNKERVIFTKLSPKQKTLIVDAIQKRGGNVCVLGHAVADFNYFIKANTSVSMKISGSKLSKHIAPLMISDDNFASFIPALYVYQKIVKIKCIF